MKARLRVAGFARSNFTKRCTVIKDSQAVKISFLLLLLIVVPRCVPIVHEMVLALEYAEAA